MAMSFFDAGDALAGQVGIGEVGDRIASRR